MGAVVAVAGDERSRPDLAVRLGYDAPLLAAIAGRLG
jgi:hypothetical protein